MHSAKIGVNCIFNINNMEYSKLVAVTGLSGLFELISSKSDGGVVRSLEDNSSKFVSSRIHNFSHIESIEVFTTKENMNLADVFLAMKCHGTPAPDAGSDMKVIKAYFEKLIPDMDFERVYASDMKKMLKWFAQIMKNNIEIKLSEAPAEEGPAGASAKNKNADTGKAPSLKSGPAKKVNAPRKMV